MNDYQTLREKHQQEVHAFPMFFAFDNRQFETAMSKRGLNPDDTDQIYKLGGTGGFYLRSDAPRLHEMFDRHEKERLDAIDADTKGTGYIFQMFFFELASNEYNYTGDLTGTLEALGIPFEDIEKSKTLKKGLEKAIREIKRRGDPF